MDIEPAGTITISFSNPNVAGNPIISPAANTTKWINYTSAIALGGVTRKITASINTLIPEIDMKIQAAAASGSGGGTLGIPSAQVTYNITNNNQRNRGRIYRKWGKQRPSDDHKPICEYL